MGRVGSAIALAALVAGLVTAGASPSPAVVQTSDILLAFDATNSMGPSIAAAQNETESLIAAVSGVAPGARFAVASFRDRFYPGGEYTLETPMTSDKDTITAAVGRVKPVQTTNEAQNTAAEAYNLLFHQTYSDPRIGWRGASRKIVVVIGDAEPHGAGADGLAGCKDTTHDWDDLDTAKELDAMRAAKRTLVMVRQAGTATTSLACYASLAARAYTGGAAVDGSGTEVAGPVLGLLEHALVPLTLSPQLPRGVSGATDGITISLSNPNTFPLEVSSISLTLPRGLRLVPRSSTGTLANPVVHGSALEWRPPALGAGETLIGHFVLAIGRVSVTTLRAKVSAATPDGSALSASAAARLRFVAHPHAVTVTAASAVVAGTVRTGLPSGRSAGVLVLRPGAGRSVTLRAVSATARAVGAPTRLRLVVAVARATGLAGCVAGTRGVLDVVDSDRLTRRLRTNDRLSIALPPACGGRTTVGDAARRLSVRVAFT